MYSKNDWTLDSEETYMLYFEVDDVEFSCDKLQKINKCAVTIKVQFLDYPPFNLEQEESQSSPGELLRFKPHQSFNLKLPKKSCPSSPKLQLSVYKVLKEACECEQIFCIEIPFNECQRKNLQNFFNISGECSTSFNISGRYGLTDSDGAFSGNMTIHLRLIRCEGCELNDFRSLTPKTWDKNVNFCPEPISKDEYNLSSSKSSDCIRGESLDKYECENLTSAEKLNDPQFRDFIYQTYSNESVCECLSPSKKQICSADNLCPEYLRYEEPCDPCLDEQSNKLKITTCKDFFEQKNDDCKELTFSSDELLVQHFNSPFNFLRKSETPSKRINDLPGPTSQKSKNSIRKSDVDSESKPKKQLLQPKSTRISEQLKSVKSKPETKVESKSKVGQLGKKKHKLEIAKSSELDDNHARTVANLMKKFVYDIGDFYPGFGRAHKDCIAQDTRVPAKMGWMWNLSEQIGTLKPRNGWRPGAINKYLREVMREAKSGFLQLHKMRPKSVSYRSKKRIVQTRSLTSVRKMPVREQQEVEPPPTLHLLRKDGKYHITMYPVRKEEKVPRLEVLPKPIQFIIEKDKDDASSTASDMEIEYSVPAAVNRYRKKPDVVHVDTQVKQGEILNAFKPSLEILNEGEKKKMKKSKKTKKGKK